MNKQKILIIGHNGLLSLSLQKCFRQKNIHYVTTSRKISQFNALSFPCIPFDLEKTVTDQLKEINVKHFSHAIICGGIAKLAYCHHHPEKSRLINQIHTIHLCDFLLKNNIIPVYCSSDLVFDGNCGNYKEDDICHPLNEYGIQKRQVEEFLSKYLDQSLILRFSKLYSISQIDNSPIQEIFHKLSNNIPLHCAMNLAISPTNVDEICQAISLLIQSRQTGLYHLSPGQAGKYNRYEFTMKFARLLKKTALIHPCDLTDLQLPFKLGNDNSLNSDKFCQQFNFEFSTFDQNFKNIWDFYKN